MSYADTNIINKMGFTELEVSFLTAFINGLYAEPHFSDQDVKDVAKGMGVAIASAKGVLGSLVKKGIVNTQDSGTGFDLIYLNPEYFYLHTSWREDSYDPCPIPEHLRDTPAPVEAEVTPATEEPEVAPVTSSSFSGTIRYHAFHTERYEVVGFEVRTSLGNAPGYNFRARVSPADLAALLRANATILDVDVWLKDRKDGREFRTMGKRWFRKIEEGGEFVRHAVRVSSISGTPYFEEEGFTDSREEFNGKLFISIKDTTRYGNGI